MYQPSKLDKFLYSVCRWVIKHGTEVYNNMEESAHAFSFIVVKCNWSATELHLFGKQVWWG